MIRRTIGFISLQILSAFIFLLVMSEGAQAQHLVPFVGCPTNVNGGDINDPTGSGPVSISSGSPLVSKLAFYGTDPTNGIFGPRGWTCFAGGLHDEGFAIYVVPNEPTMPTVTDFGSQIKGPAVILEGFSTDAPCWATLPFLAMAAHFFPNVRPGSRAIMDYDKACFANSNMTVSQEDILKSAYFPADPHDLILHRGRNFLEFETPPNQDGLGTWSKIGLTKSNLPIYGALQITTDTSGVTSATLFETRLPPKWEYLRNILVQTQVLNN